MKDGSYLWIFTQTKKHQGFSIHVSDISITLCEFENPDCRQTVADGLRVRTSVSL